VRYTIRFVTAPVILTWRQQADTTAVTWEYGYDAADQLTAAVKRATDAPQTVLKRYAYAYDPAGNRTIEQIDDQVTGSTYNTVNELVTQSAAGAMVLEGNVNEPATVTIAGQPASVSATHQFRHSARHIRVERGHDQCDRREWEYRDETVPGQQHRSREDVHV
jgi:YD repeat-containing protein